MTRLDRLISTLLFTCTIVCRADIAVSPIDPVGKQINQAVSSIPVEFRPAGRDVAISSLPDVDMNVIAMMIGVPAPWAPKLLGIYFLRQKGHSPSIYVRQSLILRKDKYRLAATIWHEYAHWIWYEIMTATERDEYSKLWAQEAVHPSAYSCSNTCEGFAESFRIYMDEPLIQLHVEWALIEKVRLRISGVRS